MTTADPAPTPVPGDRKSKCNLLQDLQRTVHGTSSTQQPTSPDFALVDRLEFLNPEHWDALTDNDTVCLSRDCLTAIHETGPEICGPTTAGSAGQTLEALGDGELPLRNRHVIYALLRNSNE